MGRRKIEIERIVDKHDRFICFSKRRKGLFKKANDLALQGFHIIILVFSKSGNAFVYGSQNAKEVIKRFLNNFDATNGAENLINEMILESETAERTEENDTSRSVHSAERTEETDMSRSETGERSKENDITRTEENDTSRSETEETLRSETWERSKENDITRTEENDTSRSETGERSKENDITRTVASEESWNSSEDSWNSLNSILTEGKHFWWNSSVEKLSWKNLLQFKSAIEDLLGRVRTKANSLLVEQNFLSGFS